MFKRVLDKLRKKPLGGGSDFIFSALQPGSIAIDCGANVGDITAKMAERGATVHAFEPNPYAFEKLEGRFAGSKNVFCYNKGVWHKNDTLKLYMHENSSQDKVHWSTGSSILEYKGNINKDDYLETEVVSLPDFITSLGGGVELLKIDVEGAECEILEKFIELGLYNKVRLTIVETHDAKIPELRAPTDRIRKLIKKRGIRNIRLDWV